MLGLRCLNGDGVGVSDATEEQRSTGELSPSEVCTASSLSGPPPAIGIHALTPCANHFTFRVRDGIDDASSQERFGKYDPRPLLEPSESVGHGFATGHALGVFACPAEDDAITTSTGRSSTST